MNPCHVSKAKKTMTIAAGAAFAIAAGAAAQAEPLAVPGGELKVQLRYRYEDVDQDNALRNAHASTLKSRLTYTSKVFSGWQVLLEGDNVSAIGDEDYNSTSNNETAYSVVADPEGTELNQAWLAWSGAGGTTVKAGRQRIVLDNERFVGGVGWRQNEQTYDGVSLSSTALPKTTLNYAWIDNVNRVFGPDDGRQEIWKGDWESSIHLLNASFTGLPFGTLTGYGYFMDIEDAPAQSNRTLGLRFAGKQALSKAVGLSYAAEWARQADYADNPVGYDADYRLLDAGLTLPGAVTLGAGLEVLEGDRRAPGRMFRTPLATLHKFQGFADLFLTTPAAGINDAYLSAGITLRGTTATVAWHDYEAEDGDASYGREWNLSLARKFGAMFSVLLKYADYQERGFGVDTRKVWLQLQFDY